MRTRLKFILMAVVGTVIVASSWLQADDGLAKEHALGDHPAVIIFKTWNKTEYMSKRLIYPHPAAIWWYMREPNAEESSYTNGSFPDHPVLGAHPKGVN